MHMSWDDLQTIEALVRRGTIAAAGRELGLRHTSVSRRVDALERALEAPLFLRGARLTPTPLALEISARGARMAREAADVTALLEDTRRARARRLVVTTNDVLAPLLFGALAKRREGPRVEVRISDAEEQLTPGVTDLALRPSTQPAGTLRGWRLGRLRLGVFVAEGVRTTRWVQPTAALRARASMRWWKEVPLDGEAVVECGSLVSMREACAAGLGRAVFPSVLAAGDGRLRLERTLEANVPVWLLASATRRADPQLQREAAALVDGLRRARGAWQDDR